MSFKKKMIKGMIGLSLAISMFQAGDLFKPIVAEALGGAKKVKQVFGDRTNGIPIYIEFTSNAPQYSWYTDKNNPTNRFYEEYYNNRFLWYSMVPRQNASAWDSYMARMRENNQKELGTDQTEIDHYVTTTHDFRYNLKNGQDSPWDADGYRDGYNTGTNLITYGPFSGKWYEWRYMGYSSDGQPIGNPYFPDDYPTDNTDVDWRDKSWVYQSWHDGYSNFQPTLYDEPGYKTQKANWIEKYLKPVHPKLFTKTKDKNWWADRLSLRTQPEQSTGVLEGWHISSSTDKHYYKTFVMQTPKRPNLRITDLQIKDKSTGKVIGSASRSTTDPYNATITYGSKDKFIHQGKTYVIEGTIRNMKENGMTAHNTSYTPVHSELIIGYDETVHQMNEYDEIYSGNNGCQPTSSTTSIKYNTSQKFKCEFTIPNNFSDEIEIGLRIPNGFFLKGDNLNNADDIAQLTFKRSPNDMAMNKTVEFIDQDGNTVDDVIPGHTYDVRFYVTRPEGDTPVGKKGDKHNPFTTLDVSVTDKGTIEKKKKVVSTEVLNKGKTIAITVENIIQPKTNVIEACASLNNIHVTKGQNILNGNDGEICRTIQSDINISVQDFTVKPQALYLPTGKTTSYENLTFDFKVSNFNKQGHSKDIPYKLYKGTTLIKQGTLSDVPANKPIAKTLTVGNVPLSSGNHEFKIELNPSPRRWLESVKGVSNPYADNVAENSINVHQAPAVVKCDVENTKNTWTTTYSIYEWWGYESSYWVYGYWNYDYKGNKTTYTKGYRQYYCVTTKTQSSSQTIDHYEEYKIENVFFKSKLTKDNNGGWVDIKGGTKGKVKAGYGFEIRVVAKYSTNINTAPKPWLSGCSGKAVSPSTGTVNTTKQITLTMPFKDLHGNNVKYTLNANNVSGAWHNETQSYEMPLRDAFGLKQTREVFVNEGAKDGTYQIKIETDGSFKGSYDKPYVKALCDVEYVNIEILGSDTDDLKTHITQ